MVNAEYRVRSARSLLFERITDHAEIDRISRDEEERILLYQSEYDDADECKRLIAEIHIRGNRRIGQLLGPGGSGARTDLRLQPGSSGMRLSPNRRQLARRLAAMPDEEFEKALEEASANKAIPTERAITGRAATSVKNKSVNNNGLSGRWEKWMEVEIRTGQNIFKELAETFDFVRWRVSRSNTDDRGKLIGMAADMVKNMRSDHKKGVTYG